MPGISYLKGKTWSEITREERVFCASLFGKAMADPAAFADWLIAKSGISMEADGYWDMGYEVCFYRDLLFELGSSVRPSGYSPKRTFDLCLFSERGIIVIEAKAFQCFDAKQAGHFQKDRAQIQKLVGREINVRLVALASSQRLNDSRWQDRTEAIMPFDGYVTWAHVNERFPDPVFMRADTICGPTPGRSR